MFWTRFYELCCNIDSKPLRVVKKLEIASGNITKWKNGSIPSGINLVKIADFFGVTTDYLLGRDNKNAILPKSEQNLLDGFRSLNSVGQDYLLMQLDLLKDKYKKSDTAPDLEKVVV